jgi:hypothetical protein
VHRIRLVHWKAEEAEERATRLQAYNYEVDWEPLDPSKIKQMRQDPPDAVVIDLSRLPSQGRDFALMILKFKDTRYVPLVFVGGADEKVTRVKQSLPDATYATWEDIQINLAEAIANPLEDPVVPGSTMDGYSGAPLPKKLGIKENATVSLIGAPEGFEKILSEIPQGVVINRGTNTTCDVGLWFVRSRDELEEGVSAMGTYAGEGRLWIIWPKKASGVKSDLTQTVVRKIGLDSGLVDYKVASIDQTWSGLCFTLRK